MEIRRANPLDAQHAFDVPTYRIHFWKGNSSNEFELVGCRNVREALAWADENAGADRTYTLYAVADVGGARALVRLFGVDPTKHLGGRTIEWPSQVYDQPDSR